MGPVLEENPAPVDHPVERRAVVGPEPAPDRQVVGPLEDVDRVELDSTDVFGKAREPARRERRRARPRQMLALEKERRDSAQRKGGASHRRMLPRGVGPVNAPGFRVESTPAVTTLSVPPITQDEPGVGRVQVWPLEPSAALLERLLRDLFENHWRTITFGPLIQGSAWEIQAEAPPRRIGMLDGYLTVDLGQWHFHLCIGEHRGGAFESHAARARAPPPHQARGALPPRQCRRGAPDSWGLRLLNGHDEQQLTVLLPNPFLGDHHEYLSAPDWSRLRRAGRRGCDQDVVTLTEMRAGPMPAASSTLRHVAPGLLDLRRSAIGDLAFGLTPTWPRCAASGRPPALRRRGCTGRTAALRRSDCVA